jgi:peptide-methionine (R)-S-oxide reductase
MITRRHLLSGGAVSIAAAFLSRGEAAQATAKREFEVTHTEAEWRKLLSPDQFAVLRKQGTERAFTSPLLHEKRKGTFTCAGCALDLFSSTAKYDSGTGWPSFTKPLKNDVGTSTDRLLGMERV